MGKGSQGVSVPNLIPGGRPLVLVLAQSWFWFLDGMVLLCNQDEVLTPLYLVKVGGRGRQLGQVSCNLTFNERKMKREE